ncbi:hypothetical protein [Croceicoccus marinus]|uniref:Uracil-DNA glycosylase-like domain-containing protein n=1 Tax=Croceicoccus marinus TaxID=450378 RepID=A0A1Z1FH09_9SPHN|nr:hypothetical protein [Croceicoccus marinus]ARU18091.1 hypothetical protein A9D14_17520 [Croceicoccus marinus]QNE06811.1 hypothetical protein H4O24_17150 [Croceicoccus marinus]
MTELSQSARSFRSLVEDESSFLRTCEGGDPGTPDKPSVWLLGIEPGWSLADEAADQKGDATYETQQEAYSVELQLTWPFNQKAFKLLSALNGGRPEDYREFALAARPFEQGSNGYFKANLFPEPFNKVGTWDTATAQNTGFASKEEYRTWMRENRFRVLQAWIHRCRPSLVIGCGLTHISDFLAITGTSQMPAARHVEVNGHSKRFHISTGGTVPIAVIPHLTGGSHSLNSNASIALVAEQIRSELSQAEKSSPPILAL